MKTKPAFIVLLVMMAMLLFMGTAQAAQVTLKWDANSPAPTGYMIFAREGAAAYDYAKPAWTGAETTCKVTVADGQTVSFVARAYNVANGIYEFSGNSNEVSTITIGPPKPEAPKGFSITQIILAILNWIKPFFRA